VLGNYPTGVCAITAITGEGERAAMVVGTFTSVSLDPPLVGFLPDKKSSTWPLIERARRFCVNVLPAHDRQLCRQLSVSGGDKYEGVDFALSDNGSPILASAIAWIDCDLHDVVDAGDHYFVLGRVIALETVHHDHDPMLFFKGKYGGFAHID
jgi:flavin reductase (DIM6/NTAB) family NADH-FMN oxidoreductase RutF